MPDSSANAQNGSYIPQAVSNTSGDTVEDESRKVEPVKRPLEQLKVREGRSLTLRSSEALEALSNFCEHRASNPQVPAGLQPGQSVASAGAAEEN